ncbi:MAG TPA: response regulator, partial [Sandaracinaceae bacterium LLY-WYZ-13_1]|nr:response regulator [Sandaracinaceae bacterium LLY-WYZ-13_1]
MAVKILAADDSETMQKVLQMTFAGEAVEIETVGSGEAALERASQDPPDLVIADASMSMDGYEVARALKSNDATANVAVLVLASQHTPFDAGKAKDAGVDDHILKPYDSQAMIDKAKEVLSKPRAAASGAPAAVPAAPKPPSPPKPPAP